MNIRCFGSTHTGRVRKNNEDAYILEPKYGLFAVADGMGGHQAGEIASWIAVETLRWLFVGEAFSRYKTERRLLEIVNLVHRTISTISAKSPQTANMGTTLSVLYLRKKKYYIAHIGDSRIYLLRKGNLKLLTKDDTLVQKKVEEGLLTDEEAKNSPESHILLRALGVGNDISIQIKSGKLKKDDLFLLATDGLTDELTESEIIDIIAMSPNMESAVKNFIQAVLQKEAKDNITALLVQVGNKWPLVIPEDKTPLRLPPIKGKHRKRGFLKFFKRK